MNYSYSIEGSILCSDNSQINITNSIENFNIENNYDDNVFPIITLFVGLSQDDMYKIQMDKNIKFILSIKKYRDNAITNSVEPLYTYFIQNKVFIPFDINKSLINIIDNTNSNDNSSYGISNIPNKFTLINMQDIDNNKIMINGIYQNVDIGSILRFLLGKLNRNNIIYQEPDNISQYNQIILPPNNIIRSIKYIDTVYGIYNNGLRLYFDFNNYYLINRMNNNSIPNLKDNNVYIEVYDTNNITSNNYALGISQMDDTFEKNNFYSATTTINNINILNNEDSIKQYIGSDPIFISQSSSSVDINTFNNSNINKQRIFYNKYNNKCKEAEINNSVNNGINILCTISNIDIDAIKCSSKYYIKLFNAKYAYIYNGFYHILKSNVSLQRIENGMYISSVSMFLKKL